MIEINKFIIEQSDLWEKIVKKANNGTLFHTRKFLSYHPPGRFIDHSLVFNKNNQPYILFPAAEKEMVRSMLSESLRSVISQTLLKKIGGGRIAAHEIMVGTSAIRNLIREAKVAQMYSAIQTGRKDGMQTLDQNLKELVDRGLVTAKVAMVRAVNKDMFR